MAAKRIRVAKIGAAHGIRGEVRLFVDADDPLAVQKLGPLEDESGARQFKIAAVREANGHLVVRFDGVSDRNAAERLTNLVLYVPRDRLPEQKDRNRFYRVDLVGLRVESTGGEAFGEIAAVQNYGAGDLLEIAPAGGGDTFLVPFVARFVPVVDVASGKVVLELPKGFLVDEDAPHPARGLRRSPPSPRKAGRGKARREAPSRVRGE